MSGGAADGLGVVVRNPVRGTVFSRQSYPVLESEQRNDGVPLDLLTFARMSPRRTTSSRPKVSSRSSGRSSASSRAASRSKSRARTIRKSSSESRRPASFPARSIAAILDREFHSIVVSRRFGADSVRETPGRARVRRRRRCAASVCSIVDETCDTGDTIRLAVAAMVNAGAAEVRTAVAFQTGAVHAGLPRARDRQHHRPAVGSRGPDRRRAAAESAIRGRAEGGSIAVVMRLRMPSAVRLPGHRAFDTTASCLVRDALRPC